MSINNNASIIGLVAISSLTVVVVFCILFYFGLETYITLLLTWIGDKGYWAWLIFILIDALIIVFLLPGMAFTLGAGFIFGFFKGLTIIVSATAIGSVIAFIFSRYLFSEAFKKYLREHKRFRFFNRELITEGWKIILLSRLIPFFPFKLSNYFFGAAQYKLKDFFLGTFIGIIPISAFNVYLGSLINDITHLISIDAITQSPMTVWIYGIGFFVAIVLLTFIFNLAQKSMKKYNQS